MPETKEGQVKKEDVMRGVGAAAGIPDVSQTITQNQATRQGFSADMVMSQVMDVWKTYLASQNFTQDMAPPPNVQALATSYGASPEMMGPAPPSPSSSITQSAAIPMGATIETPKIGVDSQGYAISPEGYEAKKAAEAAAAQPQGWSADVLAKYPELANVTDPNIIAQLQNLPDITLKDINYGPGWNDSKGRYSKEQQFGPQVKRQLEAAGMMKDGKMLMPTTQEELNRWGYMREHLAGMKQNLATDYGWQYRIGGMPVQGWEGGQEFIVGEANPYNTYNPWTLAQYQTEGKFDPAKYRSVVDEDARRTMYYPGVTTTYKDWVKANAPATTGAIPAPRSNDTGGWA